MATIAKLTEQEPEWSLFISMRTPRQVAIIANAEGLHSGTRFANGLTLTETFRITQVALRDFAK